MYSIVLNNIDVYLTQAYYFYATGLQKLNKNIINKNNLKNFLGKETFYY